jgi:xylose dehydrogenase (NAD/NADP)
LRSTAPCGFANDVVAQFNTSFAAPVGQRLEAVGGEGILGAKGPWRVDWGSDLLLRRGEAAERIAVREADSYRLELENMSAAIRGDGAPRLGRDDALGQARAIEALYRSADEGTAVALGS